MGSHAPCQMPRARGYRRFFGYVSHDNDYWTYRCSYGVPRCVDLVRDDDFAANDLNSLDGSCKPSTRSRPRNTSKYCMYIDDRFENEVARILDGHTSEQPRGKKGRRTVHPLPRPLFLFWSMHSVHSPIQPSHSALLEVDSMDAAATCTRPGSEIRDNQAMIRDMDARVGRVMGRVKSLDMWDDTLVIFSSDNGGAERANNAPLTGMKHTVWEGGIRVCAFASGGFLPAAVRGTRQGGLIAVWDWYATFATLDGVDHHDKRAAATGLPAVESSNVWPLLNGSTARSPRERLLIAGTEDLEVDGSEPVLFGIIRPPWKLLVGSSKMERTLPLTPTAWTCSPGECPPPAGSLAAKVLDIDFDTAVRAGGGKVEDQDGGGTIDIVRTLRRDHQVELVDHLMTSEADRLTARCLAKEARVCDEVPDRGCLFNIWDDPSESVSVAEANPDVFNSLVAELKDASQHIFRPQSLECGTCGVPTQLKGESDCWLGPTMSDRELAAAERLGGSQETSSPRGSRHKGSARL